MSTDNIPKIGNDNIRDTFLAFREVIAAGNVQSWIEEELQALSDENPVLHEFITDRANRFALGAAMVNDPRSVALSMAIEYMLLLKVLSSGIGTVKGLEKFSDEMQKWFPNGLEGLDGLGEGEDKEEA